VQEDGYELLRSQLPPIERRALVFIDPSYETRDELQRLHKALVEGRRRFANGVYAIWYPVGTKHHAENIVAHVARAARSGPRPSKTLDLRWERANPHSRADGTAGMQGCGMVIINPPFGLDQSLHRELGFVAELLEPGRRDQPVLLDWPVPEA
jgi:23S rRNA (adenine2030-N6)-methyltransferase